MQSGGLPLYNSSKIKVGRLGVSGDFRSTDHKETLRHPIRSHGSVWGVLCQKEKGSPVRQDKLARAWIFLQVGSFVSVPPFTSEGPDCKKK